MWRSLEGSGYLGWAVNDSEPRPLYKPVTGARQGAATRFFASGIQWHHWNEENEEWPGGVPGEEEKSHL